MKGRGRVPGLGGPGPSGLLSAAPIFHSLLGSPASMNGILRSFSGTDIKNMVAVWALGLTSRAR